jgi:DNA-binding CsgD family transcriptional regulator
MIAAILVVQFFCAFFFILEILASVLSLPFAPLNWQFVELIEIGAALGLLLGVIMGAVAFRQSMRRTAKAEEALRLASAAFMDVLEEHFTEWRLTPAERDVALFAIKGMSTGEIAALRNTSEGTVKAQTNAIYRKAGVTGRPQLLSLFIDDLLDAEDAPADRPRLSA